MKPLQREQSGSALVIVGVLVVALVVGLFLAFTSLVSFGGRRLVITAYWSENGVDIGPAAGAYIKVSWARIGADNEVQVQHTNFAGVATFSGLPAGLVSYGWAGPGCTLAADEGIADLSEGDATRRVPIFSRCA